MIFKVTRYYWQWLHAFARPICMYITYISAIIISIDHGTVPRYVYLKNTVNKIGIMLTVYAVKVEKFQLYTLM